MNAIDSIQQLVKAIEAGNYDAAPSKLTQGPALQVEDLDAMMHNVTYDNTHIKLQKDLKVESCKSTTAQFDRQLSYGVWGGSAQLEGNVGQEETSQVVRIVVPMSFYSHTRRVTLASTMVTTVDGKKSDERAAADAALKLAGDIEFDCFRGKGDFSNSGVYDGNPLLIAALPNMMGVDQQIRMSDAQRNSQDLMFGEFGSDDTVVIPGGSTLSQDNIEDAHTRSQMNLGDAEQLYVDPKVLSNYNKIAFTKDRIILAGSPQESQGADLRTQWVSNGTVKLVASRFLSGKTKPQSARSSGPGAPQTVSGAAGAISGVTTAFLSGQVYQYYVTSVNEIGESKRTVESGGVTIGTNGHGVTLTITHPASGVVRYYNVYRSAAGGTVDSCKFIGRVKQADSGSTTDFIDIGNKQPGFVTGYLIQKDTMALKELCSYSRLKLAVTDLSQPEAHFRFCTLAMYEPRKNVLVDNLR
jgi:hypothetical protein